VVGAGFCHGAIGLAHIFNRLYQANGEPVFREAARRWFGHVLDESQLEGAAGIGLALLAAMTPLEPRWDRLFLLS